MLDTFERHKDNFVMEPQGLGTGHVAMIIELNLQRMLVEFINSCSRTPLIGQLLVTAKAWEPMYDQSVGNGGSTHVETLRSDSEAAWLFLREDLHCCWLLGVLQAAPWE
jgi:hypothetical protein